MSLLEHQHQMAQEGDTFREAAHELGLATKKVAGVFEKIAEGEREVGRVTSYVSAGMSALSVAQSASGLGGAAQTDAKMAELPPIEREAAMKAWDDQAANPPEPELKDRLQTLLETGISSASSTVEQLNERDAEANRARATAQEGAANEQHALADHMRTHTAQERELLTEMYAVGAVFSRVG